MADHRLVPCRRGRRNATGGHRPRSSERTEDALAARLLAGQIRPSYAFEHPRCHERVTTQTKLPGKLTRTVVDLGGINSQAKALIEPTAPDALGPARTGRS
jgi:hypothetical protein